MKTLISLITIVLFLYSGPLIAQVPAWEWVSSPLGKANCRSIATDSSGCVFITGCFISDLIFDTTIILTSDVFSEMYIASYDTDGQIRWAKKAIGNYGDEGQGVATGRSGNIYITGEFFSNNITFDSLTLTNNYITPYFNDATTDIFLVKYDNNGQVIWAKSGGGIYLDFVRAISVDKHENITIVGTFWSPSVTFGSYTLTKTGNIDVFIVQYDSSGQVLWAKNPIGIDEENAYGIAADSSGNVYMAGSFRSNTIQFDTITLVCSSSWFDTYIVEYNRQGYAIWAVNAAGNDWDEATAVTLDKSGNIYLTGHFKSDSIKFGSITLNRSSANNIDMFLVKYNCNHEAVWARRSGGNIQSWVYPKSSTSGSLNRVLITGTFIGDGLEFGNITLPNYGSYDIYFVQYDTTGNVLWAEIAGGPGMDWGQSTDVDNTGNGYFSGYFESSSMLIGDTTLVNLSSGGKIFLSKKEAYNTSIEPLNNNIIASVYNLINYPNPFNSSTTIEFSLRQTRNVTIKIYNIIGKEIIILVTEKLSAGIHKYAWNAIGLASGIYFYEISIEKYSLIKKAVLLK